MLAAPLDLPDQFNFNYVWFSAQGAANGCAQLYNRTELLDPLP
jgi:hypothetical protein